MAKAKKRDLSLHSRAARRGATSPPPKDSGAKLSKVEESEYKPWLHNTQNAGISKKKKTKTLSRQQRQRQQRGLEHAERNVDKLEKKIADSKTRGKKIQARSKDWEELNETSVGKDNGDAEKQVDSGEKQDGTKAMEGVDMPDLEQPLPIRTAEEPGQDHEKIEEVTLEGVIAGANATELEQVPSLGEKVEAVDEVT